MIVDSKNAGGLRRSPAVATQLPRRRFAFFARFVSFRLGLATLIHAASDCRGIYPLSASVVTDAQAPDQTHNIRVRTPLSYPDSNREYRLQRAVC